MNNVNRDLAFIWDMIQAIREIQEYTFNLSYEEFKQQKIVQRAVERNFEILGEAARRVSEDLRKNYSEIDWRKIIGLRNVIIHQYEQIDEEVLWEIITSFLFKLLHKLEVILQEHTVDDNKI